MKTLKTLITVVFMICTAVNHAQSDEKSDNKNSSQETVTKIIRIKGPNGEEKVIKKQEVITKKGKIKFSPDGKDKINQSAIYEDDEVVVQKFQTTSDMAGYTKVTDEKGFIVTLLHKSGNKVAKIRPLSNGYYIVNSGDNNNCLGHFDKDENLILEMYDSKIDEVTTTVYKVN
ncbi:hypothetical protein ATE84_3129 [Aquimarina sp. MAR_2010_214]|uniref:hypothetical protein n=1 Tax=Aquimarina sp. MAR_2010_214 TaxID=1250026 RepID=UPI000CC62C75|nr:hypothetical protein [Aquimarina sp. MAR_2010_214]PKV51060.1 hypothetical protein ATE84_3129 [Aquimarina sp. MAR_2010_214]